jgi:predicted dithiol-disulfide oxidoreductase (DUF899 family)
MNLRFPNESPGYRAARDALLAAKADLRARIETVAELRRALPDGAPLHATMFSRRLTASRHPFPPCSGTVRKLWPSIP